jgi:hypothetical protein
MAMGLDPGSAPSLKPGMDWDHHWTFGTDGSAQFDVKSIVVANASGTYTLATNDPRLAAEDAAFFFGELGSVSLPDFTVSENGYRFPWYSFPLHDGKTWTAKEDNLDFSLAKVSRDLTFRATLVNATAAVPAHYAIEARAGDALRATYDYRRDIGWFSQFTGYEVVNGTDVPVTHVTTTAWGTGWTGAYTVATGDFLLDEVLASSPVAGHFDESGPTAFTITAKHTNVLAIPFAFAAPGAATTEIVAPDGTHWDTVSAGDQTGKNVYAMSPGEVFVPAIPGDWRVAIAGAGAFAFGGGCFAWGITLTPGTL